MNDIQISLTDYSVLGLLAEGPTHGFAMSKQLEHDGSIGRVLTVRRPLTYRALDRLVSLGLAEPIHTEPGDSGPRRVIYRATPNGRRLLKRWLDQPVHHIREMRIDFQLKLTLLRRSGKSPLALIRKQRDALGPTIAALDSSVKVDGEPDHVELWRRHTAAAARAYLDHLEAAYSGN